MPTFDRFKKAFGIKTDAEKFTRKRGDLMMTVLEIHTTLQECQNLTKGQANQRVLTGLDTELVNLRNQIPPFGVIPANVTAGIKTVEDLHKSAHKLLKKVQANKNVTTPGGTVVNAQMIPGYADMNPTERADALRDVDARKLRGKETLDKVLGLSPESPPHKPSLQDIGDVLWHLRLSAEDVANEAFKKGAITVPDPQGKLQKWFDKGAEVYIRDSSHFMNDNKDTGRVTDQLTQGQAPRGMDFYAGKKSGEKAEQAKLPYDMNTLLYQTFERDNERRLYIKLETEGGYIEGGKAAERLKTLDTKADVKAQDPVNQRDLRATDLSDSVLHFINLIGKRETGGLSRHGETAKDLPQPVTDAYMRILDHVDNSPLLSALVGADVQTFMRVKEKDGGRQLIGEVQQMMNNLDQAEPRIQGLRNDPNCPTNLHQALDDLLQDIQDYRNACTQVGYAAGTIKVRIGDEVVLEAADM